MKNKKKCSHFWEIIFPITGIKRQKYRCMNCGKIERKEIPVLNIIEGENR